MQDGEGLRALAEAVPLVAWVVGSDGTFVLGNTRWRGQTGLADDEGRARRWRPAAADDETPSFAESWERSLRAGVGFETEARLALGPEGAFRHNVLRAEPVGLPPGPGEPVPAAWLVTCLDVEDARRTELALSDAEAKLHGLLEANIMPIAFWDADGRIVDANDAYLRLTDFDRSEMEAGLLRWDQITPPEFLQPDPDASHKMVRGGVSPPFEKQYVLRDGRRVPVLIGGGFLPGRTDRGVNYAIDLSERRRTEEAVRAGQGRLDLALRAAGLGLFYSNLPFDRLFWNDTCKEHFGLPPEAEVTIETFYERIHPDDRERARAAIDRSIAEQTDYDARYRTVAPGDGRIRWIRSIGRASFDEAGTPVRFDCVTVDVTAKREADHERRQLAALVENSSDFIGVADLEGRAWYINNAGRRLVGIDDLDAVNTTALLDFFFPEDHPTILELVLPAVRERGRWAGEFRFRHFKTGEAIPVLWDLFRVDDPVTGQPASLATVTRDITERTRAEQALKDQAGLTRTIADNAASCLFMIDAGGQATFMNPAAQRVTGYTLEELRGRKLYDAIHHSGPDCAPPHPLEAPLCRSLEEGRPLQGLEAEFVRKDGSFFPVVCSVSPIERGGALVGAVLEFRDITEEKRARRALVEAKDQAEEASQAKDRFLAMLSHELRTPLAPVLLAAGEVLDDPATPPRIRELADVVRQYVELEARLIDDLLDVSAILTGKMTCHPVPVSTHALVRRTVEICRGDLEAKLLNLRLELNAADDTALADPARLQQVLWNLVKNAVKFTPEGGTIRVTTRAEGGRLEVEVADTGVGIEPSALPRIFNAFEQAEDATARRFGGLGLGLAISRSIAEAHGGTLTASSAGKDHGATLLLELPAVQPAPESGPSGASGQGESPSVGPPSPGPLRLLFVEDDPMTGRIMARLLRLAGHQVTTAGTLADAMSAASERFDLVVSDIGLPDGSGLDLMRHIRNRFDTPGIALSGFGMEDDVRRCRDAGFVAHLTKPVDFGKLDAVIRRVVTTRSASSAAG